MSKDKAPREWNIKECEEWSNLGEKIYIARKNSTEEFNRYHELDKFFAGYNNIAMSLKAYLELEAKLAECMHFVKEADCYCDFEGDNTEITLCKRCLFLAKVKK